MRYTYTANIIWGLTYRVSQLASRHLITSLPLAISLLVIVFPQVHTLKLSCHLALVVRPDRLRRGPVLLIVLAD